MDNKRKRAKHKKIIGQKGHHTDRLLCHLCGIYYTRSNITSHRATRAHKRLSEREEIIDTILKGENKKEKIMTYDKFRSYLAIKKNIL